MSKRLGNINVRHASDYQDKIGLLGKSIVNQDELIAIYKVKETAKYSSININILNANINEDALVTFYITKEKEPSIIDLVELEIELKSKATYSRGGIIMGSDESVFIHSTIDGVVVRIEGFEDRPL